MRITSGGRQTIICRTLEHPHNLKRKKYDYFMGPKLKLEPRKQYIKLLRCKSLSGHGYQTSAKRIFNPNSCWYIHSQYSVHCFQCCLGREGSK
ncbi:hypothetical protein GDO81_009531 [Engystomops pustulosus]|uniref:Uncharacterized protein n=1 Tax=Engystomops pustulosus TaxID=76066 RepID=A0AAV7BSP5_ENGPU|nr:hypothetical protein GDO81_009531 [Engystomops pustulosus]